MGAARAATNCLWGQAAPYGRHRPRGRPATAAARPYGHRGRVGKSTQDAEVAARRTGGGGNTPKWKQLGVSRPLPTIRRLRGRAALLGREEQCSCHAWVPYPLLAGHGLPPKC